MNWALWIWLALAVLFLVVEACTVSLVSIWFSVGALAAVVTNLLGGALWLQLLLFLVVSAALLACLRPLFRKFIKPKMVATNADSVIGTTGFVTEEISQQSGQVKLGGMYWSARSTTGEKISTGCEITVDKIEGVKVFVTQV
jgi:membrane protein implicated in regulation of membrane protease activity